MVDDSNGFGSDIKTTDPSHPFYIHHSDQPDNLLVHIKLNDINYQSTKNMTKSHEVYHSTSSSAVQRFIVEHIQKLAQAINALNQNNFGNIDAYANVTGLIPLTLVSVNSSSVSSWILDINATNHIVSHMSLLNEPKSSIQVSIYRMVLQHKSHTLSSLFLMPNSHLKMSYVSHLLT